MSNIPREHRAYIDAMRDAREGAPRRAEIRQVLIDLLDVVEQSPDEAPLVAALAAFNEVCTLIR